MDRSSFDKNMIEKRMSKNFLVCSKMTSMSTKYPELAVGLRPHVDAIEEVMKKTRVQRAENADPIYKKNAADPNFFVAHTERQNERLKLMSLEDQFWTWNMTEIGNFAHLSINGATPEAREAASNTLAAYEKWWRDVGSKNKDAIVKRWIPEYEKSIEMYFNRHNAPRNK